MRKHFREYSFTFALLLGTILVCFYPLVFNGRSILPTDLIDTMTLPFSQYYGPQHAYNSYLADGYLQFYPLKYFTKLAYEHGNFAFWNSYILNGYPQYLEGMWTYNFVLFLPLKIAFPLILLLPLLVAGVGMYALLREYDVRIGIARIFATAFMLNALFMTHLLAHFIPASFSFAPWVFLFLLRYYHSKHTSSLFFSAIALALGFLAGNIQTIGFLTLFVFVVAISLWSLESERRWKTLVKPLATLYILSLGLSATYWLPTLQLIKETINGGAFFSTSLLKSYTILQRIESLALLFTFFIPQLAGSIRGVMLHQAVGVYVTDFEGAIGFVPLLFAVAGGTLLWKKRPTTRPFTVLMLVGLLLPLGTPLFRYLYHRFFVIFTVGACGAGAIALEGLLQGDIGRETLKRVLRWSFAGIIMIACTLGILSVIHWTDPKTIEQWFTEQILPRLQQAVYSEGNSEWVRERLRETIDYWQLLRPEILFGIISSAAALVLLWNYKKLSSQVLLTGIWSITTLQLIFFARSWFPSVDSTAYPPYPETNEIRSLQRLSKDCRVYTYREVDPTRQFVFLDNENVVYGIQQISGYESIIPRCLYIYTAIDHWQDTGLISPRLLGKFNCGVLVRAKALANDSAIQLEVNGPIWIYNNHEVVSRAFLANRIQQFNNDSEILRQLSKDSLQIQGVYFTPNNSPAIWTPHLMANDSIDSILSDNGNELRIHYHASDSTYLILSDTYYPGWSATIDGKDVPLLRCNYSMRAVKVIKGTHDVHFRFAPISFWLGLWIGLAVFTPLLTLTVYFNLQRSKHLHS